MTLADPWFIIGEKVDRNVASLNFITRAAQSLDETRSGIVAAALR
jgi:hypothetical protein